MTTDHLICYPRLFLQTITVMRLPTLTAKYWVWVKWPESARHTYTSIRERNLRPGVSWPYNPVRRIRNKRRQICVRRYWFVLFCILIYALSSSCITNLAHFHKKRNRAGQHQRSRGLLGDLRKDAGLNSDASNVVLRYFLGGGGTYWRRCWSAILGVDYRKHLKVSC